jgi:prephenate dehydratase
MTQTTNGFTVRLNTANAILKFNYLPILGSSACELSAAEVAHSVRFVQLRNCPLNTPIVIRAVMSARNRPGAVLELLTPLARYQVSMSRFESRPARSGLWEYLFFVDVDGHEQDENVAHALADMREKAIFVKVLGSYPAAPD